MATFGSSGRKRSRMMEEEEETFNDNSKRYFDLNTTFSPDVPKEKNLPAITYASPDYRPPPPAETPLWLQPITIINSPMTEDDSEDELLTPSLQQQQQLKSSNQQETTYWNSMIIDDQWQ